jgi:hypothetical protein
MSKSPRRRPGLFVSYRNAAQSVLRIASGVRGKVRPKSGPKSGIPSCFLRPTRKNASLGAVGGLNPLYQIGGPRSAQLALKLIF